MALFFVLLLCLLPVLRAGAVQVSVVIDRKTSLEAALNDVTENGEKWAFEDIDKLMISGEGTLTVEDGAFIREHMKNLKELNLRSFRGQFEDGAFRGCNTLESLILGERAKLSKELFYGCSALEQVEWPVRLQLTNDCFAYCALDFSEGYPGLLNERNVLTYASNQRPKVYFTMPQGSSGTISAGNAFRTPYSLRTPSNNGYIALVSSNPVWLLTREAEVEVSERITRDGEYIEQLDTNETGVYEITYSLPYTTFADVRSQTYTLTILPSAGGIDPLISLARGKTSEGFTPESWEELQTRLTEAEMVMNNGAAQAEVKAARDRLETALQELQVQVDGLPDEVRVGESFRLTPGRGIAAEAEGWKYDEAFFSASFEEGAEFTPLKEGKSEIVYIDNSGDEGFVEVEIGPAQEGSGSGANAQTGDGSAAGVLWAVAALCMAGLLAGVLARRKAKQ